jgi:hypothetical protein
MAAAITSFTNTKEYDYLLQQPKEELAQRVLVQRDMIHDLMFQQSSAVSTDSLQAELLQEELEEAREVIRRLIEGLPQEWDG